MNTTLIGHQEWQTSNLNVTHFRNGEPILKTNNPDEWRNAADRKIPAYCSPKYEGKEFKKAGYLYNWYAVNDSRGLAPHGWLIPDQYQVDNLLSCFSNTRIASIELKSKHGWENIDLGYTGKKIDGNGTNKSGFYVKPSPSIDKNGEFSFDKGIQSFWLKEAEDDSVVPDHAFTLTIGDRWNQYECGDNVEINIVHLSTGLPVRCLKKPTKIEVNTSKSVRELLEEMEDSSVKDEILQIVGVCKLNLDNGAW